MSSFSTPTGFWENRLLGLLASTTFFRCSGFERKADTVLTCVYDRHPPTNLEISYSKTPRPFHSYLLLSGSFSLLGFRWVVPPVYLLFMAYDSLRRRWVGSTLCRFRFPWVYGLDFNTCLKGHQIPYLKRGRDLFKVFYR